MEQQRKVVETGLLLEQYRELLQTAECLPLQVTGSSMTPFLIPKRDSVMLSALRTVPKKGDIILYRRSSGGYVLHRVYARQRDGRYSMVGDGQQQIERDISREQMFAIVTQARRKGRVQQPGCFWWEFFARIWIRILPLRPAIRRLYGAVYHFGRKRA